MKDRGLFILELLALVQSTYKQSKSTTMTQKTLSFHHKMCQLLFCMGSLINTTSPTQTISRVPSFSSFMVESIARSFPVLG